MEGAQSTCALLTRSRCFGDARDVLPPGNRQQAIDSYVVYSIPVALVAYQSFLEPGIGQFCELEPRRVHTRISSLGRFLERKLTYEKRESLS